MQYIIVYKNTYQVWQWWDDIWLRAGLGADFFISDRLFVRGHLIYGVGLPVFGAGDEELTHGLLVKLGVG